MFKRLLVLLMASMLVFSVTAPISVDAKSSYKSPKKSYTPTQPQKAPTDNVTRTDSGSPTTKTPGAAAPGTKPGFFSGGLMRGLLIGGLAGMLFGGLFGGLGFLGNLLGLLVNVFALVLLFILIRSVITYFINRRKYRDNPKRY